MRSFRCAPWKRVRIFEGISGIFQDAHFLKPVRIFEWAAHLRSRASALGYPLAGAVPFSRKVLQALLRPRSRCCCGKTNLIDKPAGNWKNAGRSTQRSRAALYLGSLLSPFTISCDSHKAKEIRRLRRFRRFKFQKSASSAKSADSSSFLLTGPHSEQHAQKKSRAWMLIRARLRVCEIYSVSLYRIPDSLALLSAM
jgi:hypothetical protein